MSLPPSALYPYSGIAYNELNSCYYSVVGATTNTPAATAVLPLDGGTGTGDSNLFVQFGRDVGLKPNRAVPAGATNPRLGALVNTTSQPVAISGYVILTTSGPYVASQVSVKRQNAGTDEANAVVLGQITLAVDALQRQIPFSTILNPNDCLYVQLSGGAGAQTANLTVSLIASRASSVYGALNSIQAGYIPA